MNVGDGLDGIDEVEGDGDAVDDAGFGAIESRLV